ncbi:MAG: hypothetical protein NZ929_02935 [Aigarchaeota archaeon]|nr:hypothetical protein [Aigarchaeota archaeon]
MVRKDVVVIKVELPRWLAEKFRRYVADKYGLRRGSLSKAIADIIEKDIEASHSVVSSSLDDIVGLGLLSDYDWMGEDLVEVFRRRYSISNRRQCSS